MAEKRIKIAKDKTKLVRDLKAADDTTGPFQTFVDIMVFAAALGAKRKKRVPLVEFAKDLDPIRRDYFDNHKCDLVINLLAISETQDQKILAQDEESDEQRITIFEEYANGGLEILQDELRGAVEYSEQILLMMTSERLRQDEPEDDFDLSRFLS
ncbi:MAG: DNA phosphorothioation-associated protein 4 [Chroococcidiopsidaceae cyanobacterium CP_BM_ER_R8_30]|nr:DNA phosphorothioation-associated protein 4 [Chroococcidiopsidaceae cyanobacterium CP_BM_ER_R8_30]